MDLYAKGTNKTNSSSNENHQHVVAPASISQQNSSSSNKSKNNNSSGAGKAEAPSKPVYPCFSGYDRVYGFSSANCISVNCKRKRRSSTRDPEIGCEPPSAKRQHCLPAAAYGCHKSRQRATSDALNGELVICSSPAEELSDGAHSQLPDSPDSPLSLDQDGGKQQAVVVRYAPVDQAEESDEDEGKDVLGDISDETSYDEDEDEDEKINASSSSPGSSTATNCSQNGERTPATQQMPSNGNCSVNKDALSNFNALEDFAGHNSYKCMSPALEPTLRACPLPALSWANATDVWNLMYKRDEEDSHLRSSSMMEQHPGLQPRMRAILLDWLIEVCEVYKLHRETFYLAVDYHDRYLHKVRHVQKTHLQLIGITCLFVAAKVEEIYPPKICEFAYVTDGACTEHDILQHEKLLLQALEWDICPVTVTGWLGMYMQLNVNNRTPPALTQSSKLVVGTDGNGASGNGAFDDAFIYPQFSGFKFVHASQLLDLCTLDVGMANYPYSVLAAAAISHTFDRETAVRCSGLDFQVFEPCARWMEPFFNVISKKSDFLHMNEQNDPVTNKFGLANICPNIVTDDSHIIQTHTTTMDMYDELLMEQNAKHAMRARTHASPATALRAPESQLTPPTSIHKPEDYLCDEAYVSETSSFTAIKATDQGNSSLGSRLPLQQLVSHKKSTVAGSNKSSCSSSSSLV